MKSSFRSTVVFLAVLLAVVGVGYYGGRHQWLGDPKGSLGPLMNRLGPSHAEQRFSLLKPKSLEDEKIHIADLLAGNWSPSAKKDSDKRMSFAMYLRHSGFDSKNIPDLISMLHDAPDSGDKQILIYDLIGFLVGIDGFTEGNDPELAMQLLDNVKDPKQRQELLIAAISSLCAKNPQEAANILAAYSPEALPPSAYNDIFQRMVDAHPAAAAALAARLPPGPQRNNALMGVVESWFYTNPQGVLDWALTLPAEDRAVFNTLIPEIAGKNPELAAANLDKMTNITARNNAVLSISGGLASGPKGDPAAALTWLSQAATGNAYETGVANIFEGLTTPRVQTTTDASGMTRTTYSGYKPDPALAVSLLDTVTDPNARQIAISSIADGWGKSDPKAALAWAGNLPSADASVLSLAVTSIMSSWLASDSKGAIAFVQNSTDSSAFLPAAPTVAQAMAKSDPQAALTWTNTLPEGSARSQALSNVLVSMSGSNMDAAWSYAANLPPGESQNMAMANLVAAEAKKDPAQAATLLGQIPASPTQLSAASTLASTWVKQDPQAFTIWLDAQPAGQVRDTAIVQLASSVQAAKDPAGVLAWVNTVSDPQTRASLVRKVSQNQISEGP